MKGYIGLFLGILFISAAYASPTLQEQKRFGGDAVVKYELKHFTVCDVFVTTADVTDTQASFTAVKSVPAPASPVKTFSFNLQTYRLYAVRAVGGARKQVASASSRNFSQRSTNKARKFVPTYTEPVSWS